MQNVIFFFELTSKEFSDLRSNNLTANFSKTRTMPKIFTEQGIYMLATILKSKIASDVTISIIRTFLQMRNTISANVHLHQEMQELKKQQLLYEMKSDENFNKIFNAIEDKSIKPKQGIFYNGEVFDAYTFIADIIRDAKMSIVLIDNFVDDTTLTLFSKNQNITVTIYTKTISKQLKLDLQRYNTQYKNIEVKSFKDSHDRFMIVDAKEIYHIGASLKDLGKKWFALSKFDLDAFGMLDKLNLDKITKR